MATSQHYTYANGQPTPPATLTTNTRPRTIATDAVVQAAQHSKLDEVVRFGYLLVGDVLHVYWPNDAGSDSWLTTITNVRASGEIVVVGHGGAAKTIGGPRQLVMEAALGQGRLVGARARAWQNVFVWRGNVKEGTLDEIRLRYYSEMRA